MMPSAFRAPSFFRMLMRSTRALGKLFSTPNRTPIRFMSAAFKVAVDTRPVYSSYSRHQERSFSRLLILIRGQGHIEIGIEGHLRNQGIEIGPRCVALLFEIRLLLARRVNLVLGVAERFNKALGGLVALERCDVVAIARFVAGQSLLRLIVLAELAIDVGE